jgi:hypothetical protein
MSEDESFLSCRLPLVLSCLIHAVAGQLLKIKSQDASWGDLWGQPRLSQHTRTPPLSPLGPPTATNNDYDGNRKAEKC